MSPEDALVRAIYDEQEARDKASPPPIDPPVNMFGLDFRRDAWVPDWDYANGDA